MSGVKRVLALVLAALCLVARPAWTANVVQGTPRFAAEALAVLGDSLRTVILVRVTVPYSELLFVKTDPVFRASCLVTIDVKGKKGGDARHSERTLTARALSYQESQADSLRVSLSETFDVVPGEYSVDVRVQDAESRSRSSLKLTLAVENLRARSGTLSPLTLGYVRAVGESLVTLKDVVPHSTRVFGVDAPLTAIGGEVYLGETVVDTSVVDTSWTIAYRFYDESGELRLRGARTIRRAGVVTPFVLQPNLRWLSLGSYKLEVEVVGRGSMRTVLFDVDESAVDLDHDFARLVAMISYIASNREMREFRDAVSVDERMDLWKRFWERRRQDPDDTANDAKTEFFRRVRRANQLYHSGGMEGWRTDRGRIYIKFGPPDQVDESPATGYQRAREVWRYYSTRAVFIFADRDGFGRYVLVSSNRPE